MWARVSGQDPLRGTDSDCMHNVTFCSQPHQPYECCDSLFLQIKSSLLTEVGNLQRIYPLKDEWVFGCSLETRLVDQTKTQQLKWLWSKDSMNSTINQRLVEQTQETNFKLEGSGGSTLGDTLRKQYLSSSDE